MIFGSIQKKHPEFNAINPTFEIAYLRTQIVAGVNYYFGIYVRNDINEEVLTHMKVYEKAWEETTQPSIIEVEQIVRIETE